MLERLLVISCSRTKSPSEGLRPAWERYDGRVFRLIRELQTSGQWPTNIDVLIISARFGLLRPSDPIPWYDEAMTFQRAEEHRPSVSNELSRLANSNRYRDCFVLLEPAYLATLPEPVPIKDTTIVDSLDEASLTQLREWIRL